METATAFTFADLSAYEEELGHIERAMTGLNDGTYGRCAACGNSIEDALLDDAPLSITCGAHLPGSLS
jgi:RNA polymerase-binding transcription factor DksA